MSRMSHPFVTLVYIKPSVWKLLAIYDDDNIFFSEEKSYSELRYYKYPFEIERYETKIIIHAKNNKNLITLDKY